MIPPGVRGEGVPPPDLAVQAGAECGEAGMSFQSDGSRSGFHGLPGDGEEVSALPIPIVLPREVILGKERRGRLWFFQYPQAGLAKPGDIGVFQEQSGRSRIIGSQRVFELLAFAECLKAPFSTLQMGIPRFQHCRSRHSARPSVGSSPGFAG